MLLGRTDCGQAGASQDRGREEAKRRSQKNCRLSNALDPGLNSRSVILWSSAKVDLGAVLSPDGGRILTASDDNTARL